MNGESQNHCAKFKSQTEKSMCYMIPFTLSVYKWQNYREEQINDCQELEWWEGHERTSWDEGNILYLDTTRMIVTR